LISTVIPEKAAWAVLKVILEIVIAAGITEGVA